MSIDSRAFLACASGDLDIQIYDIWGSKIFSVLKGHTAKVTCLDLLKSLSHNVFNEEAEAEADGGPRAD